MNYCFDFLFSEKFENFRMVAWEKAEIWYTLIPDYNPDNPISLGLLLMLLYLDWRTSFLNTNRCNFLFQVKREDSATLAEEMIENWFFFIIASKYSESKLQKTLTLMLDLVVKIQFFTNYSFRFSFQAPLENFTQKSEFLIEESAILIFASRACRTKYETLLLFCVNNQNQPFQ